MYLTIIHFSFEIKELEQIEKVSSQVNKNVSKVADKQHVVCWFHCNFNQALPQFWLRLQIRPLQNIVNIEDTDPCASGISILENEV